MIAGPFSDSATIRVGSERVPLTVGNGGTCGLGAAGELYCWGKLGRMGTEGDGATALVPSHFPLDVPLTRVSSGGDSGCGITRMDAPYAGRPSDP